MLSTLVMRKNAFLLNPWPSPGCRSSLYHCNYCQKDISNVARIKCAVCADFDLCLECFSAGVEITPHKNYHAYRVVDNLSFPIFHPDWGVSAMGRGAQAIIAHGAVIIRARRQGAR
jgi:hypothetical protein